MTLESFLKEFDTPSAVVLLEGKREVLEDDREKLIALGRLLASRTKHMRFRSGNAGGADQLFSEGVAAIDQKRMQVVVPYRGHRQKTNQASDTIALEDIDIAANPVILEQSKRNKKTASLIDRFAAGLKNRSTIAAAYIIRDTIKVTGVAEIAPATFGIFYDDLKSPRQGGTGHTIDICEHNAVPWINQQVWFSWLTDQ